MKAIVFADHFLKFQEVSLESLPSQWARIKVEISGLCGTDVAKLGRSNLPSGHTQILGHEFVGTVVEINGASDFVTLGDIAVCVPILPCGTCETCLGGMHNLCAKAEAIGRTKQGAFAEYVDVPIGNLIKVPKISYEVYVLADPLAVCLHAVKLARQRTVGCKSLVIGDGSIGCLLAWFLRKQGKDVSIKGRHSDNLRFIKNFGVHPVDEDVSLKGYDEIYETVGRQQGQTLSECIKAIKPGGVVVVLGVYSPGYTYPLAARELFIKETHLIGANAYTMDEFVETVSLIRDNELELVEFISHTFTLSKFSDALEVMCHKRGLTLKVVLKPENLL